MAELRYLFKNNPQNPQNPKKLPLLNAALGPNYLMASYEPLFGVLFAVGFFVLLAYLGHREKRRRPMHDRPNEIDAQWGQDYRGPGRKGEPFFAPGGVILLVMLVVTALLAMWLRGYIEPIADWLVPAGRSPR